MAEPITDVHADDVLNRLDALLNQDKASTQITVEAAVEVAIPLLTEVYTPAPQEAVPSQQQLEDLLPVMVNELEEMMRKAIVELRPKTEELLRQHLEQALAQKKSTN